MLTLSETKKVNNCRGKELKYIMKSEWTRDVYYFHPSLHLCNYLAWKPKCSAGICQKCVISLIPNSVLTLSASPNPLVSFTVFYQLQGHFGIKFHLEKGNWSWGFGLFLNLVVSWLCCAQYINSSDLASGCYHEAPNCIHCIECLLLPLAPITAWFNLSYHTCFMLPHGYSILESDGSSRKLWEESKWKKYLVKTMFAE